MSSLQMRHPKDGQLLRYADGELPAHEAGEIRSHLEACWQCRMELDEIHKTVSECVRYRKNFLQAHLPPPPAPWGDISRRFTEIDASLDKSSRFGWLQFTIQAKRWVPAAIALALILALVYQLRHTPSVQAAELLRKAIAAADARHDKPRRIQIHTKKHRLTRVIGAEGQPAAPSLEALFAAAHYSWEDPLSAKSYQAWRDQLSGKQDNVWQSAERNWYWIRTATGSGPLMEATLKLRVQDLRPVEQTLQFRNQETIEITELPEDSAPPDNIAARPAQKREQHAREAGRSATLGDELRVLAALHGVGADLGDPIEVSRSGARILVSGVGITAKRQQQVQDALGSMPNVVVQFSVPANTPLPERQGPLTSPGSEGSRLQARLEEQIGGRASFEQLSTRVLDVSDAVMSRVYALRRLAERFPRQVEAELSVADKQLLGRLRQEHTEALIGQTIAMERLLQPVLVSLGRSPAEPPRSAISSDSWQPATEELFRAARRSETLVAAMFGGAPADAPDTELPSQLLAILTELRTRAEDYGRLR